MSDLDPVENREARLEVQKVAAASKPGPWVDTPELEANRVRKTELDDGERVLRSRGEQVLRALGRDGDLPELKDWAILGCYLLRFHP